MNFNYQQSSKKEILLPDTKLSQEVSSLISLIYDIKNMKSIMIDMNFDVQRMPLGKLSKKQIRKGMEILKQIEDGIKNNLSKTKLTDLCNQFYTCIPHSTGASRKPLPVIDNLIMVQEKADLLEVPPEID